MQLGTLQPDTAQAFAFRRFRAVICDKPLAQCKELYESALPVLSFHCVRGLCVKQLVQARRRPSFGTQVECFVSCQIAIARRPRL